MNTHPSQQMTLLGLATMACYAVLLATGTVGIDVMPQFAVSAIIFLSSGRLMRQAARKLPPRESREKRRPAWTPPDWEWLGQFLNWFMALLIIGVLALWAMKPAGVDFFEAVRQHQHTPHSFHSDAIP